MPILSEHGVKIHIGKGMLSESTVKSLNENNSIFVITPPVAALLTNKVLEKECVLFENEGMEAMFKLKVENNLAIAPDEYYWTYENSDMEDKFEFIKSIDVSFLSYFSKS